ncbi:hypothetical protein DEU56DRAFT_795438 [Suillus clintonianus]|uniref:uncharacterized protein n=1 Tax=Suillus clintonianus TaxID=1904413 RepID=UPI001B884EB2|nr:uncharacterized protein DEU56DRAFT_795438 [Suillus clintonianus]KAG2141899.1 hypothetical protein DEU56DRAFT_795438 [Suillus clintonianus]
MQTEVNLLPASDIIAALQIILRSQVIIPDLETSYSRTTSPNSNHCAIELEDQSISAIVTERQQQMDAILPQISSLETVMDSVQHLHRQLVEQKNKIIESMILHKRLGSALWRFPTEILTQIFHHCLPQIPQFEGLQPPSELEVPMLLTRICRRWREVALGMPSLWCELSVDVVDVNWQRAAFCYDTWLKRTRGHPLSLTLQFNEYDHSTKLRHLLQPYISQITSLSVDFYYPDTPGLVILPDFLALEELSVVICAVMLTNPLPAIGHYISQLSTLRSFSVTGLWFDHEDLSFFEPVWPCLTNATIDIDGPETALHLLQLAPNLSSLTIHMVVNVIQALESFTHIKLQSLHITCESERQLSDLLNALSLPTLRVLDVRDVLEWPHKEFKAFLLRSRCPLESLIVRGGATTDEQRAEYITLVPSFQIVARGL